MTKTLQVSVELFNRLTQDRVDMVNALVRLTACVSKLDGTAIEYSLSMDLIDALNQAQNTLAKVART